MVRRRLHAWWVGLFFALGGACLSWPVWHAPWQAWQTHLDRQDQWDALAHSVRELKQTQQRQQEVSRDAPSPADAADARDTSPPAWRAALQQMAQAQGVSWRSLDMGQPLWVRGAWVCPFELQALGEVMPWLRVWQRLAQRHPGSVWTDSRIAATASSQTASQAAPQAELHLHWHLPCRIAANREVTPMDDPFSLSAWQTLHAQRVAAHPSFAALSARWQRPRTPLERFTLDQVHYVGRMDDAHQHIAVVQVRGPSAPAQTHGVEVGHALGANLGTVVQIDSETLTVQEWLRDEAGVWRSRLVRLPWEGPTP